ncbi:site-specific integrase [Polaribacter vadi]|uniref:tyrosine-type recombinase/integrase n=1 Tax=Polaribacter vadi TaxID=1774273 RepID=UPI0030EDA6F6
MITSTSNIKDCFDQYLSECEYTKRLSSHTMNSYRDVMKNFLKVMPEIKTPMDLHPYLVHEFFKRLGKRAKRNDMEIKVSTIRTYFNKLNVFFNWLEINDLIEKDSLTAKIIKPPNPRYNDAKALSNAQVSKIVGAIAYYNMENDEQLKRDIAIIKTLEYSGIRKGELLGLRVQDVDFMEKTLFINGDTSKSKKSRYIPLHYSLQSALKLYLKTRVVRHITSEYLFVSIKRNTPLTRQGMKYWVKKYKRLSGVNFHLHQFRHTFACNLAIQGTTIISIKNLLGHSTTQMTERYLRSIQTEDARSNIDSLL